MPRITPAVLRRMKAERKKAVWLALYDAPSARIAEQAGVDVFLVGDSAATTVFGHEDTIPITLETMLALCRAVARARKDAMVVLDLPFGSYQASPEAAFAASVRALKEGGADAVKMEGGAWLAPTVAFLAERGVGVVGHVGLLPQAQRMTGSLKRRGEDPKERQALLDDAKALAEAGAVALVLEHVPAALAREITESVPIPTVGIGAGPHCDAQVLVWHDLLGLSAKRPPFAPAYAELGQAARKAIARWAEDVRSGRFPEGEA
ncbi:MAG: 3-methyl-2-oxobutanoate hydroxymethyltransferase [Zetaproteobacteria bacterium]|nr:MAG: 3-methyl-2-oxobutanoate hydroxymethyltransferase [Zetaproteobacteria bacterium]